MKRMSFASPTSIELFGTAIPEADDRQRRVPDFDQQALFRARILCIGAGGLISHIAPTLARKGVGAIILLDHDTVEASNLNRQRFYREDIGKNKAVALARNVQRECISRTEIHGIPLRFEEALEKRLRLECDLAVCGVDNNQARTAACRHFRAAGVPVIFTAVSADADHGYVFVQDKTGPCFGCVFPDAAESSTFPCPGTPAITDILQAVGALAVYAIDTCLMKRGRSWNFRQVRLSEDTLSRCIHHGVRSDCSVVRSH